MDKGTAIATEAQLQNFTDELIDRLEKFRLFLTAHRNTEITMIAGPLFGILLMYVSYDLGGGLEVVTALAVIVAVLLLRPQGIFGRPHARRV